MDLLVASVRRVRGRWGGAAVSEGPVGQTLRCLPPASVPDSNIVMQTLIRRHNAKTLTEKVLLLLNRGGEVAPTYSAVCL